MDDFLERLDALNFFESFDARVRDEYAEHIRTTLAKGLAGPNAETFEVFPGLALVVTSLKMDLDSVESDIEELSESSFDMFDVHDIQVVGSPDHPTLEFILAGKQEAYTGDVHDFPFRSFEFAGSRWGRINSGIRPHAIVHPSDEPRYHVVYCTHSALERIGDEKLIPKELDDLRAASLMAWVEEPW